MGCAQDSLFVGYFFDYSPNRVTTCAGDGIVKQTKRVLSRLALIDLIRVRNAFADVVQSRALRRVPSLKEVGDGRIIDVDVGV